MPILVIYDPKTGARGAAEFETDSVLLGRGRDATIRLAQRAVSKRHAIIERTKQGGYRILDLQSANGVRLNHSRVREARLRSGDEIEIGEVRITFFDRSKRPDPPAPTAAWTGPRPRPTPKRRPKTPPRARILAHPERLRKKSREERLREYRQRKLLLVLVAVGVLLVLSGLLFLLLREEAVQRVLTSSPAGGEVR